LIGYLAFRTRRRLQRTPETGPAQMSLDWFRHSVFALGFQLTAIENPTLRKV
jgi:hypothetical protein